MQVSPVGNSSSTATEAGTMLVGQLELQGGSILCASYCSEKNAQILALGKSCWTFSKHLAWETSRSLPIVPRTTPWPLRWPWSQESKSITCLGTQTFTNLDMVLLTWKKSSISSISLQEICVKLHDATRVTARVQSRDPMSPRPLWSCGITPQHPTQER